MVGSNHCALQIEISAKMWFFLKNLRLLNLSYVTPFSILGFKYLELSNFTSMSNKCRISIIIVWLYIWCAYMPCLPVDLFWAFKWVHSEHMMDIFIHFVCCRMSRYSMLFFVPCTTVCSYFAYCIIVGNVMQTVTCITIDSILIGYFW